MKPQKPAVEDFKAYATIQEYPEYFFLIFYFILPMPQKINFFLILFLSVLNY